MEGDSDASSGWFTRFKNRHGIREVILKGELLSGNVESAEMFKVQFEKFVVDEGLLPEQIYNTDESGLFCKCLPTQTLAFNQERCAPGHKISKDRLPLLIIEKAKKPHSFKGTEPKHFPVDYYHQKSA